MKTIDYYNRQAEQFIQSTFSVDMESLYLYFLNELPKHARILDLGCGSGRDSLAFKNKGYLVDAIDYSEVLVQRAIQFTGIQVKLKSFYEIEEHEIYDGIWACASLLHCERDRLAEVIERLIKASKPNGVLYMSFKHGSTDREEDGRKFTDLNETQARDLLEQFAHVQLIKQWMTLDQRPDRQEQWLNLLWKKHA